MTILGTTSWTSLKHINAHFFSHYALQTARMKLMIFLCLIKSTRYATFEHLKQMEFLSRSVFSKAAGREGLSSSLVSKTFRVPLSSRPWWPLHSTSLSCNNTESSLTLAYCMTWKGNHATKMRGGQTRQRSLVEKGKSRIRRPGAFSTNREYVATKKKKKKPFILLS